MPYPTFLALALEEAWRRQNRPGEGRIFAL